MQTLLVIENNLNVELLNKLFSKIHFVSPIYFQDPALALEWCESNEVDVILVSLSKRDALHFVEQFKYVFNSQYVPIIMVASTRDLDLKIKALELSVSDFISFPLERMEFVNRIKNAAKMRIHQKSHLLAQKRLYELQKLEAVNCLTAGVAHEFNNLLMGIQGFSDLNQLNAQDMKQVPLSLGMTKELSDDFLSNSQQISQAIVKGKLLVEQMLAYCRRDEMQHHHSINLHDFMRENFSHLFKNEPNNIRTIIHLNTLNRSIYLENIDTTDLAQIFWNTLRNSRDALNGKNGKVDITFELTNLRYVCSCCSVSFQGDFIKIDISDDGHGIDAELLPRIFDPFFTTKEVGSGTGLGLSVIAGLIHNAKGYIQVTSIPDVKTTFSLFFPYSVY